MDHMRSASMRCDRYSAVAAGAVSSILLHADAAAKASSHPQRPAESVGGCHLRCVATGDAVAALYVTREVKLRH